jgi:hypothetical protein
MIFIQLIVRFLSSGQGSGTRNTQLAEYRVHHITKHGISYQYIYLFQNIKKCGFMTFTSLTTLMLSRPLAKKPELSTIGFVNINFFLNQ